ncbi:MAG TPA: hypothetical protein VM452_02520 [Caulifigura sp.]|nr:hypothetical protein [Caulifigura sp.]
MRVRDANRRPRQWSFPSKRFAAAAVAGALCGGFSDLARGGDPRLLIKAAELQAAPGTPPAAAGTVDPAAAKNVNPPAEFAGQEGVLALMDGRVVYGTVTEAPGGYLLKRPGKSDEMIPAFLVRTAAGSLTGCYENLRGATGTPRPDSHLELADWCLRQRMYDEAKIEVVDALKLDPNRRDARELLTKLEEATNPQPRHRQAEAAPTRTVEGFLESTGRLTEGISPEATGQFVRRIQPLLVSKCANGGCHGGDAGGEFRLVNIRRSSSSGRVANLENLREVISLIDAGDPGLTKLLGPLKSPVHSRVFTGTAATTQEAALREWVQGVAIEKGLKPPALELVEQNPVWTRERIELVSGEKSPRGVEPRRSTKLDPVPKAALQKTAPPQLKKVVEREELVERVLKEERPDPFDPDEFNRKAQKTRQGVPENPQ